MTTIAINPALLAMLTQGAPAPAECQRAALATRRVAVAKKNIKDKAIEDAGGDAENVKKICMWVPKTFKTKLITKGYEKKFVGRVYLKDDEDHDQKGVRALVSHSPVEIEYEVDKTVYVLLEVTVPRAGHPRLELDNAKFEGRYRHDVSSTTTFFAEGDRRKCAPQTFTQVDIEVPAYTVTDAAGEVLQDVPRAEREAVRARHHAAFQKWGM